MTIQSPLPWNVTTDRIDGKVNVRASNDEWVATFATKADADLAVSLVNQNHKLARMLRELDSA